MNNDELCFCLLQKWQQYIYILYIENNTTLSSYTHKYTHTYTNITNYILFLTSISPLGSCGGFHWMRAVVWLTALAFTLYGGDAGAKSWHTPKLTNDSKMLQTINIRLHLCISNSVSKSASRMPYKNVLVMTAFYSM